MSTPPPADHQSWLTPQLTFSHVFGTVALTVIFNTVIALFLDAISVFNISFLVMLVISQCVGLSICIASKVLFFTLTPRWLPLKLLLMTAAILVGTFIGIFLSTLLVGDSLGEDGRYSSPQGQILILGLFFGSIIAYFFISRDRLSHTEMQAQEERLKRETAEKQAAKTELRLLQAQIEPHFLFNTLSTLLSLLETDTSATKQMLEDLIHYLRTSLATSRREVVTLSQEADLIRAYLMLFKVRMGDRLTFDIHLPESLNNTPFAPMLIQPLVENAIKHGLEPKVEGGHVSVTFAKHAGVLRIQVADTGLGLKDNAPKGVGLENIQERLNSLYDDAGRLVLNENAEAGLTVTLEVPCG